MTGDSSANEKSGLGWKLVPLLTLIVVVFGLGVLIGTYGEGESKAKRQSASEHEHEEESSEEDVTWTCSMHPQIKLPKPGKCPICFMDLIPLESGDDDEDNPLRYSMSQRAKTLAQVKTSPVKRDNARVKRRLVGMVFQNEQKVAALTSRIDGRLDQVFIDFVGAKVEKGDPMVTIWSPTLIRSQVELFETLKSTEFDEQVSEGAEEKLAQYGLTEEQIEEIKRKKEPILYVTLKAPISGIVMEKNALLGQFVQEGDEMFIITDLSTVWVKLDAYESDLPWIRYGQKVTFTTPAAPGRVFTGKVLFIDPVLQMKTRSVKVRVEAENPELLLKPHMLVTAEVEAEIDAQGRVINPEWADKAVCPVHPDVTGKPGEICPTSKRALQPPSAFGYATDTDGELPLVIPSAAVLFTGQRSVVYVEVPESERPTYELREVKIGPRAGDQYVVLEGLEEGERVVTHGNFKIDSAMQILARPSMMNPVSPEGKEQTEEPAQEEVIEMVEAPGDFLDQLSPIVKEYLSLKEALVDEKFQEAAKSAKSLSMIFDDVQSGQLEKEPMDLWKDLSQKITKALDSLAESDSIQDQRKLFDPISENMARLIMSFRHRMDQPVYLFLCPMAFNNRGAYWLEISEDLRNPYFGQKMLKCGELIERIPSISDSSDNASSGPETETTPKVPPKVSEGPDETRGGQSQEASGSHTKTDDDKTREK
jgi:Cu(I)/Ag(I) efflux system membrane fusion protein